MLRIAPSSLALLLVAACADPAPAPPLPASRRDQAVSLELCREAADRVLIRQDRGQLMREEERNARLGSETGAHGVRAQLDSLGRQFRREQLIQDCLRQASGGVPQPRS
ncbi:MAG: hypothetical protein RMK64_12950 [Rhodovarius sp.]|nr:hypothetical protein [Rhodovarius sp.]MDW8315871.1 hypothetical protein [Rhodovarius sp.]